MTMAQRGPGTTSTDCKKPFCRSRIVVMAEKIPENTTERPRMPGKK
jgi:hypothetical protein